MTEYETVNKITIVYCAEEEIPSIISEVHQDPNKSILAIYTVDEFKQMIQTGRLEIEMQRWTRNG